MKTDGLTIEQMSELFQKSRSTINEHILNIYKEGELEKSSTIRKIGKFERMLQILSEFVCGRSEFYLRLDGK